MELTIKKLVDCCDVISDGDHLPPPKTENGIPFITISNITATNHISFDDVMYVPEEYYAALPESKKAQKGDILYSVVGSFGIPVYINDDQKFIFQRHIAILRPNQSINGKYLYYLMLNPIFYKRIDKLAIGCSQRTVTLNTLRNLLIELPNKDTQNKIVSILSAIDKKINTNSAINENLEAMAKTIYDYWFLQFEFPNEEGKPYKSSGGKMVWNDELGQEVPKGWEIKSISSLCNIYQPQTINNNLFDDKYDYPVYGGGGYVGRYYDYNHEESEVVIACRGSYSGRIFFSMPKSWITGNAMVVRPTTEQISKNYLFEFLKTYGVEKYITGSAQKQLTRENLSLMPILCPQKDVLIQYEHIANLARKTIEIDTIKNRELTKLRDFLLPLLMNGQVGFKDE